MAYFESVFNHTVPEGRGDILFNVLSGGMIHIPRGVNILELEEIQQKLLFKSSFIVDKTPEAEFCSAIDLLFSSGKRLYLIFTLTTRCDLHCSYCFQNREKRLDMPDATIDQALRWLSRQFEQGRFCELSVILFGGEPLLVPEKLHKVLHGLEKIKEENSLRELPVLLTTNALIDDVSFFESLVDLGVTKLQVTVDGNADVTNERRKGNACCKVYETTLEKLPLLSRLFDLTIKLNFSPQTMASIPDFMDDISCISRESGEKFRIKPEPIVGYEYEGRAHPCKADVFNSNSKELAEAFDRIFRLSKEYDIDVDSSAVFSTPCMAFRQSSYLIEPDGSLRSCISAFGIESFSVGHVANGSHHERQNESFARRIADLERCKTVRCSFLPLCGGGCAYDKELKTGNPDGLLCRNGYYEEVLPVFVHNAWRRSRYKPYILSF